MNTQKKSWEKPQLIVLSRGTPEESVLLACKFIGAGGNYPGGANQNGCAELTDANCSNCQSRGGKGS